MLRILIRVHLLHFADKSLKKVWIYSEITYMHYYYNLPAQGEALPRHNQQTTDQWLQYILQHQILALEPYNTLSICMICWVLQAPTIKNNNTLRVCMICGTCSTNMIMKLLKSKAYQHLCTSKITQLQLMGMGIYLHQIKNFRSKFNITNTDGNYKSTVEKSNKTRICSSYQ